MSLHPRGMAFAVLATGVACALGAGVAFLSTALLVGGAKAMAYPLWLKVSLPAISLERVLADPWREMAWHMVEFAATVLAVCVVWTTARPIASLPIRWIDDEADADDII